MAKTELEEFIQKDLEDSLGVYYPVKAGILERLLKRRVRCDRLHPNPEDEFCFPDIGPHYGIISDYVTQFSNNIKRGLPLMEEPLFVQKTRPDGYMLLNGHHRWAAARRLGLKKVPVCIVNQISEKDIIKLLEASDHNMRATIDLDEVLFRPADDPYVEKGSGFIRFGIQKKRLRLGAPAVLLALRKKGFDIWVYSSDFYSVDDVHKYFRRHNAGVDGVITGMKKKKKNGSSATERIEKRISDKYGLTLHIDNDMILITRAGTKEFDEVELKGEPGEWSKKVIQAVEGLQL